VAPWLLDFLVAMISLLRSSCNDSSCNECVPEFSVFTIHLCEHCSKIYTTIWSMFFREGESDLQLRFIIHIIESNMHNARLYVQAECHRPRLCRFATPTPGFLEHCIVHSSIYQRAWLIFQSSSRTTCHLLAISLLSEIYPGLRTSLTFAIFGGQSAQAPQST